MNAKVEQASGTSAADIAKLALAALILVGGIAGFYYFADAMQVLRVLGLLAALVAAVFVGSQTALGRSTRFFLKESSIELRKVVWPTRDEATNLTTAVLFVTLLMTLLLGSVDWVFTQLLDWVVRVVSGA